MPNINSGVLDGVRRIGARVRDLVIDGGLPGAPLGFRLRGATTSGAPATGTWKAGDVVTDRAGVVWTCTTGGTPGTWAKTLVAGNNLSDVATRQTALDNLAGATTNNQVLAGNGSHITLRALAAGDIPGTLNATTFSGAVTPSSGVAPYTTGFTAFATGGAVNLLNSTSGTSVGTVAGTFYYAALWIPFNVTLTGVILTTGTVGGTDNWIVALWPAAGGAALANSSLSGIVAPAANTKKQFAFTGTVNVNGPGAYIIGVQSNGTTAKFLAFANAVEGFVTGSVAGSFGTVPSLTPAGSYSAGVGPFATTY